MGTRVRPEEQTGAATAALESLTVIKRAGADFVVSYWAKELASWL